MGDTVGPRAHSRALGPGEHSVPRALGAKSVGRSPDSEVVGRALGAAFGGVSGQVVGPLRQLPRKGGGSGAKRTLALFVGVDAGYVRSEHIYR